MSDDLIAQGLESDISMTHDRFVVAMSARVPGMSLEQKERYFALLNGLVTKLETTDKDMREILQEMMSEAMSIIMAELNSGR